MGSLKEALDTHGAPDDTDAILYKDDQLEEMKHLEHAFDWLPGCADSAFLKVFICDVSPQPL